MFVVGDGVMLLPSLLCEIPTVISVTGNYNIPLHGTGSVNIICE